MRAWYRGLKSHHGKSDTNIRIVINKNMDTIADMFTKIRNAAAVRHETVCVPYSKIKMEIARLLESSKYVKDVARRGKKVRKVIEMAIVYDDGGIAALREIKRISKPSRRVYASSKDLRFRKKSRGFFIMSTPKGVMSDKEAINQKVGGEVLGEIW
jgi:small subunit ribosomal protein S8